MSESQLQSSPGLSEKDSPAALNGDLNTENHSHQVNGMLDDPMQASFHQDNCSTNPFDEPQNNVATIPQGLLIDFDPHSQGEVSEVPSSSSPDSQGVPASPPPVSSILQPQVGAPPPIPPLTSEVFNDQQVGSTNLSEDLNKSELEFCQVSTLQTDLDSLSGEKSVGRDERMTSDVAGQAGDEPSRLSESGHLGSNGKPQVGQTDLNAGLSHPEGEDNRDRSSHVHRDGEELGSTVVVSEGSVVEGDRREMDGGILQVQNVSMTTNGEEVGQRMGEVFVADQEDLGAVQEGMENCVMEGKTSVRENHFVNGDRDTSAVNSNAGSSVTDSHSDYVEDNAQSPPGAEKTASSGSVGVDAAPDGSKVKDAAKEKRGIPSPKKSGLPTRSPKASALPLSLSPKGWDSTVVIPPKPRPLSALITPKNIQEEPPQRSRPTSAKSSSESKKYGISTKQQGYKPGGGDVKIFSEKKDYTAEPRIDAKLSHAKSPKPASPRTPPVTSPPPKTSSAKSKIGSMDKITHKPGGGEVAIVNKKTDVSNISSKIGSKDKLTHKPGGGNVKIETKKIVVDNVTSKVGSFNNARHKPGGGDKKIETKKLEWKVESKVGSLDNAKHCPGGGDKKIESQKVTWNTQSKIGSLENAKHVAGGGEKKIESKKLEWRTESKVGSLDNAKHVPGGGSKKIESKKVEWNAESKVGSMDKVHHTPGGGDKKIETKKLDWKTEPKVGSLDKIHHTPGGGNKKIESQKLTFKESAKAKTDHGASPGNPQSRSSTSSTSEVNVEQ